MKPKVRKMKDDDGTVYYESFDGKRYATRSGAWKRNQKVDVEEPPQTEAKTETETDAPLDETQPEPVATEEEPTFTGPEWAQFDFGEIPEGVQVIPTPLKRIRRVGARKGKPSKAEAKADADTNQAILKMGYRTGDLVLTKYGQAVTVDKELIIAHSEDDYAWISSITYAFLEDRGISLAAVIGPGTMAAVCNAYWFGKPIADIQKKAKKSPVRNIGKSVSRFTRFFRLPSFLRRKKKVVQSEWKSEEGFEP